MAKTYRTGHYGVKIEEFEVLRETDSTIWFQEIGWDKRVFERRSKKESSYEKFHVSWEAAKDYLLERALSNVESKKAALQHARSELGQVESFKNPVTMAAELNQPASQAAEHIPELDVELEQDVAK